MAALSNGAGMGEASSIRKTRALAAEMIPDMTEQAHVPGPLRVLVSEGNSTSAREAITILGLSGHLVEVCDPSPYCLARFSRFVRKFHICPAMRDDPAGFLSFVEKLLATRHFDVLLPIHEQGFLFARVRQRLQDRVGLALPSFESYRTAHSKAGFSRLLDELGLPQPATRIVKSAGELRDAIRLPSVVKTSVGTASRGNWCPTGIRAMLKRELYKGERVWNRLKFERVPESNKRRSKLRDESGDSNS